MLVALQAASFPRPEGTSDHQPGPAPAPSRTHNCGGGVMFEHGCCAICQARNHRPSPSPRPPPRLISADVHRCIKTKRSVCCTPTLVTKTPPAGAFPARPAGGQASRTKPLHPAAGDTPGSRGHDPHPPRAALPCPALRSARPSPSALLRSPPPPQPPHGANKRRPQNKGSGGPAPPPPPTPRPPRSCWR